MQAAFVGMILDGAFLAISFVRGDHWRLTSDEKLVGGAHLNNVALALMPEGWLEGYNEALSKAGPILGAIVPLTAMVGKRIAIDNAIAAQKETSGSHQKAYGEYANSTPSGYSGASPVVDEPLNGRTDFGGTENYSW
jgi:hypothetical protein